MEVEIVGATISSGEVTIYSSTGAGVTQYVVNDETDGNKYAIRVNNRSISVTQVASPASDNPIVQDTLLSSYREIVTNNGVIGVAITTTVQDDTVILIDEGDSEDRKLVVSNNAVGTADSNSTTETFSFDDNDVQQGSTLFSSITGITTSGISDGFIKVRGVSKLGEPCNQKITIDADMKVRFYSQDGRIKAALAGQDRVARYKIMAEPDADVDDNDLIYPASGIAGITMAQLDFVRHIYNFDGVTHHIEAEVFDL